MKERTQNVESNIDFSAILDENTRRYYNVEAKTSRIDGFLVVNSIAHLVTHPVASEFLIMSTIGLELTSVIGCSWKYGFNFLLAMKTRKNSFCQCRYLCFASDKTSLT